MHQCLYMQIEAESGPIPMALVQNKVDLMDQVQCEPARRHLICAPTFQHPFLFGTVVAVV